MTLDGPAWFCLGLHVAAAVTGAALAWRRPSYRATAGFLVATVLASAARVALQAERAGSPVPYVGMARLGYHVDTSLFLAWPLGIAALARWTFAGRRPWPVLAAWLAASAALAVGYPAVRGAALHRVLLGIELGSLAVAGAAFVVFAWARRWPAIEHAAAMAVLGFECATLAGPWLAGPFTVEGWRGAVLAYAVLYAGLSVLQGGFLWSRPSRSSPSSLSPPVSPRL